MNLSDYGLSTARGFLAGFDPAGVTLPAYLQPAPGHVPAPARKLSDWTPAQLPRNATGTDLKDFCASASDAELRIAMLHYSFMVQAYVWGEPDAPAKLPACLAVPIWQIGQAISQPPLLPYSSYTLENWTRFDEKGPIDLSNIRVIQHFEGGMDETWFILVHVPSRARAGEMLMEATRWWTPRKPKTPPKSNGRSAR